jgi:hypothetical protein
MSAALPAGDPLMAAIREYGKACARAEFDPSWSNAEGRDDALQKVKAHLAEERGGPKVGESVSDFLARRKGSAMTTELPPLPKWSRQSPNHIHFDADQMHAYAQEYAAAAVAAEQELQRERVRAHIGRSVMSVYSTVAECKAARDALQRLLDEMGQDQKEQACD